MAKAAHVGVCQVCGSEQKLPGGGLSKHGYTTRWGFFSGVCRGAHHLPFEQSKDLIEDAIAYALTEAVETNKRAQALRQPATEPVATCQVYREHSQCKSYEKSGYAWVKGAIKMADKTRHGLNHVVVAEDGREYYVHADGWRDEPLAVATYNNASYARHLDKQAEQMRQYADWQRNRIANWQPQELRPVK